MHIHFISIYFSLSIQTKIGASAISVRASVSPCRPGAGSGAGAWVNILRKMWKKSRKLLKNERNLNQQIFVDCILKQIVSILDVTRMRKTWILLSYFTCKIFSPVVMGAASATIKRFSHSYTIKYLSTPFYNQARCKCVRLEVLIAPKT